MSAMQRAAGAGGGAALTLHDLRRLARQLIERALGEAAFFLFFRSAKVHRPALGRPGATARQRSRRRLRSSLVGQLGKAALARSADATAAKGLAAMACGLRACVSRAGAGAAAAPREPEGAPANPPNRGERISPLPTRGLGARARRCSWSTDFHTELRGLREAAAEAPTHTPVQRPRQRARRRDFEQDLPEVRGIAPARRRNPGGSNMRFSRHRGRAHPAEALH